MRSLTVVLFAASLLLASGAQALEEQRGEEAAIKACDQRLCTILLQKDTRGDDLQCKLTKTWARSKIKEAESHQLSWAFGDARCTAEINLERARLIALLSGDRQKFSIPPHTVNCIVEQDGKLEKVKATVAPKILFVDGRAEKVWINLKDVDGPTAIRATLITAAQLADNLGLFRRRMVKSINRYIDRHCPKTFPQLVRASSRKGDK